MKIKLVHHQAKIPKKSTKGAAAYDLYSIEKAYLPGNTTLGIRTGIVMEVPVGWKGEIYSRSGMAAKGVVVANSPGKIDCDYRGEVVVLLHNQRPSDVACIEVGDRIAQFEISPVHDIEFEVGDELSVTDRGEGGFGSTGV